MHGPRANGCWPPSATSWCPASTTSTSVRRCWCAARGATSSTPTGARYLDCYSGVTVVNAGHSNPEILEAAIDQLRRLQHTTTIYLTEPMLELARAIAELTPAGLRRSFFCASGSEANEGALLLATLATGRQECVYLSDGLHGRTKWAMSVTGLDMWRTDPAPAADGPRHSGPAAIRKAWPALERLLRRETIAAVIAEPIQGNGGIVVPPEHYWPELRRLCSRYGTLLIADEIQTAWNRTGRWFATRALERRARHRDRGQGPGQRLPDRRLHHHRRDRRPTTPGPGPRRSAATWCRARRPWPRCASTSGTNSGERSATLGAPPAGPAARAATAASGRSPRCAAGA